MGLVVVSERHHESKGGIGMNGKQEQFIFAQTTERIIEEIEDLRHKCDVATLENIELKTRCKNLEDQHQQDCIRINDLTVTINTLTRMYAQLRKTAGID